MNAPSSEPVVVAFAGARRIAEGPLSEVLPRLKLRHDRARGEETVLLFDDATGRAVDVDLRGTLDDVRRRTAVPAAPRGPGRPRLGVASREVTLLPRHWAWLDEQEIGASAALRRLVENGMRHEPDEQRAARVRAATSRVLGAVAGDRPGYEEALRALFRGDLASFEAEARRWPRDIRDWALSKARLACTTQAGPAERAADAPGVATVSALYEEVWSRGERAAIERRVAPAYRIHADPGDAWEGRTLTHADYASRVSHSRQAFADLVFTVDEAIGSADRVAVRWHAEGRHVGDLPGAPATGRRLRFAGQTFYELKDGRVAGHWQVVDRLGFFHAMQAAASKPPPA